MTSASTRAALSTKLFLWALAACYAIAFASYAVQAAGLIGSDGILPMADYLSYVGDRLGTARLWQVPTLFWLDAGNPALLGVCWGGVVLACFLAAGLMPVLMLCLLWLFYLSLLNVSGLFLGYQWDILLLEVGLLAIFLAPLRWWVRPSEISEPPSLTVWLLRWLLFRLMFMSGVVKLLSGDETWWNLTALNYHYETTPLPTWTGWYLHQLPQWFQQMSTAGMFFVELVVPFFFFAPRRLRRIAGFLTIGFQVLILATGNYNFFNLLTIALCLLLFDDTMWPTRWRRSFVLRQWKCHWPRTVLVILCLILVPLSVANMAGRFLKWPDWVREVRSYYEWSTPFHLTSNYGLFANMTTVRDEIRIEGSRDGITWQAYEFKWKPNKPSDRPRFVEPHQPRLDWQMWFAALRTYQRAPWLHNFMGRLLEGSEDVLSLLKTNPFPDAPPQYIRARVARYRFSDWDFKQTSGHWWVVGPERDFSPTFSSAGIRKKKRLIR